MIYYIKPQQRRPRCCTPSYCILLIYYIKPQRCGKYHDPAENCILLIYYIKPQQSGIYDRSTENCILLIYYIKPQPCVTWALRRPYCILLIYYIKPQRRSILSLIFCVLRCPTPDEIRCCALRRSGFDAIFSCENSECQRTDAAYKCIKKIRVAAVFRGGSARSCPRNCGFRRTVGRSRSKEW